MFYFFNPLNYPKNFGFITFSGGMKMEYWAKMGYRWSLGNLLSVNLFYAMNDKKCF